MQSAVTFAAVAIALREIGLALDEELEEAA
jgi:hypothetical protein